MSAAWLWRRGLGAQATLRQRDEPLRRALLGISNCVALSTSSGRMEGLRPPGNTFGTADGADQMQNSAVVHGGPASSDGGGQSRMRSGCSQGYHAPAENFRATDLLNRRNCRRNDFICADDALYSKRELLLYAADAQLHRRRRDRTTSLGSRSLARRGVAEYREATENRPLLVMKGVLWDRPCDSLPAYEARLTHLRVPAAAAREQRPQRRGFMSHAGRRRGPQKVCRTPVPLSSVRAR